MSDSLAHTSLSIPLKYTYFLKPLADPLAGKNVLYETRPSLVPSQAIWKRHDASNADTTNSHFRSSSSSKPQFTDNLSSLQTVVSEINSQRQVKVALVKERIMENTLTLSLHGPPKFLSACRARVLEAYNYTECRHIALDGSSVFNNQTSSNINQSSLNPLLCQYFEVVADSCQVSILLTDFHLTFPTKPELKSIVATEGAAETTDSKPYHILIYGNQDRVRFAEFKLNVLLESMAGHFVDSLPMDLSMQPLVAGPELANFKYIMLQTKTKIFTPDWIPNIPASQPTIKSSRNYDEIYITGPEFQVSLAVFLLKQIMDRTQIISKECDILPGKVDLLDLNCQDELRNLMISEGSFIHLPRSGAASTLSRIQSSNENTCNCTMKKLLELTTQLYSATYLVHNSNDNSNDRQFTFQTDDCSKDLDKIAAASGAIITCKETSFEVIGFKNDTKRAVSMISNLPMWKVCYYY
jgi:hypothetical protein